MVFKGYDTVADEEKKGVLDELREEAENQARKLKKKGEEMADEALDKVLRKAGKVTGKFTQPETKTETFLLWSKTWLVCSRCGRKFGPVDSEKWKEHKMSMSQSSQLALGAATGNPLLIAKGSFSVVKERGGMEYLKSFQDDPKREEAKHYLVQCEYCGKWFCQNCWDMDKNVCTGCSKDGLKSVLGL